NSRKAERVCLLASGWTFFDDVERTLFGSVIQQDDGLIITGCTAKGRIRLPADDNFAGILGYKLRRIDRRKRAAGYRQRGKINLQVFRVVARHCIFKIKGCRAVEGGSAGGSGGKAGL